MTQNKVTILEAAKALNIGRKTIYRWIAKGLLSKHKEGNKTLVILEDVRALCDRGAIQQDTNNVTENVSDTSQDTPKDTNTVTLDRQHYEGLLIRLGQLEAEKRYLLEYKGGLEAKDKELTESRQVMKEAREKIRELQQELERTRLPWWRRWLKGNLK